MIEDYINKHSIMGMLSKNYKVSPDFSFFIKNKQKKVKFIFNELEPNTSYYYLLNKPPVRSKSSTLLISNFNKEFFLLQGDEFHEFRENNNKYNNIITIKKEPNSINEILELIKIWELERGEIYRRTMHSGYDKNFFNKFYFQEKNDLFSLFFYLSDKLVGYSITSKITNDDCYRYIIRKNDIKYRNLCMYIDYKMFEEIWQETKKDFYINWGASSGGVLKYKRKFPNFLEKKVYFI